ncbi:putative transcriptional regulator [Pseudomonas phage MR14]|nr:putative transcriptional regulator [Pseudomonas phage MR14]
MSKSVLHMNIDAALKQELQRQADAANRSLSNHVETLLLNLINPQPKETSK